MYLSAVHNKLLLVVSFKIYSFQTYARGPVFLPQLKLILELCAGWSVIALEFLGHSGHNFLIVANATTTQAASSKQRRWGTTATFSPAWSRSFMRHFSFFGCGDHVPFQ
jgi:hypothetical protein